MSTIETVLIVGAGPAGLVLALCLVQNDIPVRVIDKTQTLFVGQRGSGIMPRSMEIYRSLGVLPDILRWSIPVPRMRTCEIGSGMDKVISVLDMSPYLVPTPDCPYLNPIVLGQGRVQGILRDHLKKYECEIEFATELKCFEQCGDHVVAHVIKNKNGTEVKEDVRVGYLVGADGARGIVRKQLGLSFLGETRVGEHWVIADVVLKGIDTEFWNMWGDFQRGLVTIRPTDRRANNQYWIAIAGHNIDWLNLSTKPGEFVKFVRKLSGLQCLEVEEFLTLNYVRINIRMVDKFGEGRVFVAGDAAHAHSFTGGQGMNSSIQDAFNLGWKLALTSKSLSSPKLLESYNSERLPIIADMLEKTTELLNKTVGKVPQQDGEDSPFRRGQKFFQLDVHYRGSLIVFDELHWQGKRLRAGDRAPDAPGLVPLTGRFKPGSSQLFDIFNNTQHTALIFSESNEDPTPYISALGKYPSGTVYAVLIFPKPIADQAASFSESEVDVLLDSHEYCWSAYPTLEGAKVVIVRPDGYVGAIVQSVEGIERYRTLLF